MAARRVEQIGDATLYLGDCLEVMAELPAGSVDVVVTDPPYGINTKSDGAGKISPWGDWCNAAFWYAAWLFACREKVGARGAVWSFLNWRSLVTFQKAACDIEWPIESLLVWDKGCPGTGGMKGLRPSYELVALWAAKAFALKDRGILDIKACRWSSTKPNGHPAEKPIELMSWLLLISGGDRVLDPFMGSGTTGVAALNLGRKFIGIEIEPKYFDIACRRIEQSETQGSMALEERAPAEQIALGAD